MSDPRGRFEAEILPHLDAAYRFARWLSGSPSEAEDVVQEAMLRAFRSCDSLRSRNVKGWLLAIVRNCQIDAAKVRLRHAHAPLPEELDSQDSLPMDAGTADPESDLMRLDEQRTVERLLFGLAEEHREVLVLREIEDLGYREIAAITNVPIGTVMSRLARARAALKALWEQTFGGDTRVVL
jgi:RNA polymerase sigma factor (sigma-70 family)